MVSEFFQILLLSCVIGKCFNVTFCEHVKTNFFLQNFKKLEQVFKRVVWESSAQNFHKILWCVLHLASLKISISLTFNPWKEYPQDILWMLTPCQLGKVVIGDVKWVMPVCMFIMGGGLWK